MSDIQNLKIDDRDVFIAQQTEHINQLEQEVPHTKRTWGHSTLPGRPAAPLVGFVDSGVLLDMSAARGILVHWWCADGMNIDSGPVAVFGGDN